MRNIFWEMPDIEVSAWARVVRKVSLEEQTPQLYSKIRGLRESDESREGSPKEPQEKALTMI